MVSNSDGSAPAPPGAPRTNEGAPVPDASSAVDRFYARNYAKLNTFDASVEQRVAFCVREVARLPATGRLRLLEIGCGTGANLVRVGEACGSGRVELLGLDVSEEAVLAARSLGIQANRLDLNNEALPYADGSLDCVLFLEVLEHLYYSDLTMAGIARVLRRGGLLIVTTPNLASWANRMAILLGFQPFSLEVSFRGSFGQVSQNATLNGHVKSFTRRALRSYVQNFGFTVVAEGTSRAAGVSRPIALMDRLLSWSPSLASHTMLSARRD
jgi:SAM-dependent methyltransferase